MRFTKHVTHEHFIQQVRDVAVSYASNVHARVHANGHTTVPALSADQLAAVARAKLLYGRGHYGLRGVTQYGAWVNGQAPDDLIEVCAASEESWIQLAGTTIHELAHTAAGIGQGHGKEWKNACAALGLRRVHAAGTVYQLANFAPQLRMALALMEKPADGTPAINGVSVAGLPNVKARPCAAGVGVRGGKSRGVGSGSRLRKYVCDGYFPLDVPESMRSRHGQIIRASTDNLDATCNVCGGKFILEG
jgi:hypothetical protein